MSGGRRWLAVLCLCGLQPRPAVAVDIDWPAVEREATELLTAYIRIDTTNPPGNETPAARFLADRFQAAGIEAEVFEAAPGRGSVLARLPGTGKGKPIILLNHLDVVPADPKEWQIDPFAGVVRDGIVHGRGAMDCKGIGSMQAMAVLLLKRHAIKLPRDVIFLGTADEETGGSLGAGWVVAHRFDELRDAEFVLNEGGHIRAMPDGRQAFHVAVSEKTPCWLRLTANGKAGHGSTPPAETAVTKLLRALTRLTETPAEIRVTPEVQTFFAAQAPFQVGPQKAHYLDLRQSLADDAFRKQFLLEARNSALVRDTLTPTVLSASPKTNVIPRTASAEVDCRLLPDADPRAFVERVVERIADPGVQVQVILNFPPSSSSTDTHLYRAIARQAERAGGQVIPSVLTGFTDSHYFREKGIVSYGFAPFVFSEKDTQGQHGVDERINTANLRDGTRRLMELLQNLDAE